MRTASTNSHALPRAICLTLLRPLVGCVLLTATVSADDRFDDLDTYVREAMPKWQVSGLAIAVIKDGSIVLARGYGNRQLGSDSPVTAETVFPIASCTKSFTACCIAILVDEGKLNWDDPVRNHLPEFRVADPYVTEHVTIRDLLCHRTGLVRGDLLGMSGGFTRAEMLSQAQFLPQAAPFRSKVTYNNLMFTVLGEIVKKKSGLSWQEFVSARLFEPLEMKTTTTDRAAIAADQFAIRHRIYDGKLAPLQTPNSDKMAEAGAIHSTVTDMTKWLSLHLRTGEHDGNRLVGKKSIREMHSLHQSIPVKWRPDSDVYDARFIGTGLGWFVRDYRGRKMIQHGGAWGAEMAFMPEEDLGVVVLSNRDWNGLAWMLIYDVFDAYLVGPDQAWRQREKWKHWLRHGGPEAMDRDRKKQRTELETNRKEGTRPSLPLPAYAGTYRSKLYSDLDVTVADGQLRIRFGNYAAKLDHWDHDSFYGHAVIEPFLDWLVKFEIDKNRAVRGLEIMHVGWKEADEQFLFERRVE